MAAESLLDTLIPKVTLRRQALVNSLSLRRRHAQALIYQRDSHDIEGCLYLRYTLICVLVIDHF